jgi:L-asparaginase II
MANPVLVEVTRGAQVESRHRGALVVTDADGRTVFSLGETDMLVFPRSAVKAIQALPLVESGAAVAFGFGERELALAQASHNGEPQHVAAAAGMLAKIGLDESALECGAHAPLYEPARAALREAGMEPCQLHNNCSGKHSGFLAVARKLGVETAGYINAHHPVQEAVREAMESVTGALHDHEHCGTDGCSIPTYAVPLISLARGFARFGTGAGLSAGRAKAARRIYEAGTREAFYVAGTGRICTEVMAGLDGALLMKTGAEGVFCAAVPGRGLGIALKCEDGATAGSQAIIAAVLARLFPDQTEMLRKWTNAPVLTRRGAQVGEVRAVAEAFAPLS